MKKKIKREQQRQLTPQAHLCSYRSPPYEVWVDDKYLELPLRWGLIVHPPLAMLSLTQSGTGAGVDSEPDSRFAFDTA